MNLKILARKHAPRRDLARQLDMSQDRCQATPTFTHEGNTCFYATGQEVRVFLICDSPSGCSDAERLPQVPKPVAATLDIEAVGVVQQAVDYGRAQARRRPAVRTSGATLLLVAVSLRVISTPIPSPDATWLMPLIRAALARRSSAPRTIAVLSHSSACRRACRPNRPPALRRPPATPAITSRLEGHSLLFAPTRQCCMVAQTRAV